MNQKTEHIHIEHKGFRGYKATYNDVEGYGETALAAYFNAKEKYKLIETSKQLEILGANFEKTLEEVRV